jgi:hypothetical protein
MGDGAQHAIEEGASPGTMMGYVTRELAGLVLMKLSSERGPNRIWK